MAVPATMSAVALAALIALPGQPIPEEEGPVPGAGDLHITVTDEAEDRLSPGDRVEYTVKVRNSGGEALPEARITSFLPDSMRYVDGAPEGVETGRATWERPLEAGERATLTMTAEVVSVPERGARPVSTVCLAPSSEAALVSCASSVHHVPRQVPLAWIAAALGAALILAIAAGGLLRLRSVRRPRPEPEPEPSAEHGPGEVPDVRAFPDRASVHHLDAHR